MQYKIKVKQAIKQKAITTKSCLEPEIVSVTSMPLLLAMFKICNEIVRGFDTKYEALTSVHC